MNTTREEYEKKGRPANCVHYLLLRKFKKIINKPLVGRYTKMKTAER